jgi:hypothetical protein
MNTSIDEIQEIINAYEKLVLGIEKEALGNVEGRAYGGIIRAGKGKLVESIAKHVTTLAWKKLGEPEYKIKITKKSATIPIRKDYVDKMKNEEVKNYIKRNIRDYMYKLAPDWVVLIDNKPAVAIECKAYTENAMLKRILVDCTLLKQLYQNMNFVLFQLESQLGGDYSDLKGTPYGSPSTHTLLSYFDIELFIITLLKGERKVDQPIHKKAFFKPLTKESLENAINTMSEILKQDV